MELVSLRFRRALRFPLLVTSLCLGCGAALPQWPANAQLQVTETAPHYIALLWPAAEDATSYVLSVDGDQAARVEASELEARVDGLDESRSFVLRVQAANEGGLSPPIQTEAATNDGTSPSFPVGAQLNLAVRTQRLTWPAATDRDSVSYIVFVNGEEFARTSELEREVEIIDEVRYAVVAEDASGNRSAPLELTRSPGDSSVVAELGRSRLFGARRFDVQVRPRPGQQLAPNDQSIFATATRRCHSGNGMVEFRVQTLADGRIASVHPMRRTVDHAVQGCFMTAIRTLQLAPGQRTLQVTYRSR